MDRLAVTRAKMADSQKRKKESALASTKRRKEYEEQLMKDIVADKRQTTLAMGKTTGTIA